MNRLELIKSDEYITDFLEAEIVSGYTLVEMRKNVAKKWKNHRDELLQSVPNHTSDLVISAEEIKSIVKKILGVPDEHLDSEDHNTLRWMEIAYKAALEQSHPLPTSQIEAKALELKVEDHYKVWFVAFQMYCANCVGHGYPKHESGASMTYWELADYFDNSPERKKYYDHVLRNGSWKEVKDFSAPQVNNGWREEKGWNYCNKCYNNYKS